ncbi:MAG TPA: DUF4340 domain-containing protein [Cyclobacteriaceae bacterium]|nr:DUF4340 domain-containing protein [Cyclobacteriaceae bacterium]
MQQKRNIRLLISLCVLIAITATVLFLFNRNGNTVDKTIFRVTDLQAIDKVVLERDSAKTELAFDGIRWKVNSQTADRALIDVLFATLQQAEPRRKVSEKFADSLKTFLENNGVHVTLFQHDEPVLDFFAGGNAAKTQAWFAKAGDDAVYNMVIPGYRVYTSGIFELEAPGWKDKYVFNFNWQNFKSLNVAFTASPADNYEVTIDNAMAKINGVPGDTTRFNNFMDAVLQLTVDQYLTREQAKAYDSALISGQGFDITIMDIANKTYTLKLYPEAGKPRVFGMVHGTFPAVFDTHKVVPLMKSKGWFTAK